MPRRSTQSRRPATSHQQTRQAHTVPQRQAPPQQQHQTSPVTNQQQQPRQPGLFGQMASTAAGVAIGSSVGHAIGGLFTGGSSQEGAPPMEQQQQQPTQEQYAAQQQQQNAAAGNCEADAKAFAKCLEDNTNDISACQWYLDQLKSCRKMAQQY